MRTKNGSTKAKQALELGVTGSLFMFGWVVIGTMYVLNRALGGVERSPPIPRPERAGREGEVPS